MTRADDTIGLALDTGPTLTADEERALLVRAADGDAEARDELVMRNFRLAASIAMRYTGRGLDLDDLFAHGVTGLLRAVDKFDLTLGTRFTTYATPWVYMEVRRAVANGKWLIQIPENMFGPIGKWKRAEANLAAALGRPPTADEVGEALDLPANKRALIEQALAVLGMARYRGGTDDDPFQDGLEHMVADEREPEPADEGTRGMVARLLNRLEPREQVVIRMRYGIGGEGPCYLWQVSQAIGVTRERSRQIEQVAMRKLTLMARSMGNGA